MSKRLDDYISGLEEGIAALEAGNAQLQEVIAGLLAVIHDYSNVRGCLKYEKDGEEPPRTCQTTYGGMENPCEMCTALAVMTADSEKGRGK